jgi:tetratricopeptide (TPR) repeat protein
MMKLTKAFLIPALLAGTLVAEAQDRKRKPDTFYEAAEQALNEYRYEEALDLLNECLKHHPGFLEAYSLRGSVRETLRDLDGALTDFSIYLETYPDDIPALLSRAVLRYRLAFYEQAREDFLRLLDLTPTETNVLFYRARPTIGDRSPVTTPESGYKAYVCNYLGLIEAKLKNYNAALKWYDSAIQINPSEPDYYVNRGLAREALNDSTAGADYHSALALHPEHTLALHNLKTWEARMEGKDLTYEDRLTETLLRDTTMLYAYLERAQQRFEGGYFKGAEDDYSAALALDPDNPEIWLGRGLARERQKNLEGAFSDYTRAIDLRDTFFKAWINRGNVLFKLGRYNAAIEDFSVALVYNETYAPAYYNRAMAKAKLKDRVGACDDLKRAEHYGMAPEQKVKGRLCE